MKATTLGLAISALLLCVPRAAFAQDSSFQITDNSFLVEEAFNQDKGIFQNIFSWARSSNGAWSGSFTQEWPAPALAHQLSYSIPFAGGDGDSAHVGGILLNYRYQALVEAAGRPAFSPRVSVILPSGRASDASDRTGIQVNLPFSKQRGPIYYHWNAGFTWLHDVPGISGPENQTTPLLAGSVVWNTRPMINLLLESTIAFAPSIGANLTREREKVVTLSPGLRGGWNLSDDRQIVIGAAMPVTFEGGEHEEAVLLYFSYELPFTSNR